LESQYNLSAELSLRARRGHGQETLSYQPGGDIMSRDSVTTDAAPKSASYSQAVRAAGLVFVSGQAAFDAATGQLVGTTIQEQTRQCLANVSAILAAAGSSLEKVVSATFILRDPEDFAGMNEEWRSWFPIDPPARQGAKLPVNVPGMRVSISVIAEA
jgi:2-iminobutanoate/2-iminopropanoate deaminase